MSERIVEVDEVKIPEPLWSVKSRVSWGALLAGAVVAIALYSLLSLFGVALGVTVSDRFTAEQLGTAATIWTFVTLLLAMFIGGWVSTRATAGEFRNEAMLYGVIVWGVTSLVLIPLSVVGIGTSVGTVLASQGIAKVKSETVPVVVMLSARSAGKSTVSSREQRTASNGPTARAVRKNRQPSNRPPQIGIRAPGTTHPIGKKTPARINPAKTNQPHPATRMQSPLRQALAGPIARAIRIIQKIAKRPPTKNWCPLPGGRSEELWHRYWRPSLGRQSVRRFPSCDTRFLWVGFRSRPPPLGLDRADGFVRPSGNS